MGEVITIDYSWGEIDIVSSPIRRMVDMCALSDDDYYDDCSAEIEPDDIDVSDTVTVVWEISG